MRQALQQSRSTVVRRPARVAGALAATLVVLATAGCGDEDPAAKAADDPSGVVVFFVEDGALKPVVQESSERTDGMAPQGRASLALKTLLREEPAKDAGHTTLWGRACVSGASVKSLSNNSGKIVVKLGGAGGRVCTKSGAEDQLQQQQFAWTLVKNFEVDPSTPITLVGNNGAVIWDSLLADEKVLAG